MGSCIFTGWIKLSLKAVPRFLSFTNNQSPYYHNLIFHWHHTWASLQLLWSPNVSACERIIGVPKRLHRDRIDPGCKKRSIILPDFLNRGLKAENNVVISFDSQHFKAIPYLSQVSAPRSLCHHEQQVRHSSEDQMPSLPHSPGVACAAGERNAMSPTSGLTHEEGTHHLQER